jgi:hypothetical protein
MPLRRPRGRWRPTHRRSRGGGGRPGPWSAKGSGRSPGERAAPRRPPATTERTRPIRSPRGDHQVREPFDGPGRPAPPVRGSSVGFHVARADRRSGFCTGTIAPRASVCCTVTVTRGRPHPDGGSVCDPPAGLTRRGRRRPRRAPRRTSSPPPPEQPRPPVAVQLRRQPGGGGSDHRRWPGRRTVRRPSSGLRCPRNEPAPPAARAPVRSRPGGRREGRRPRGRRPALRAPPEREAG